MKSKNICQNLHIFELKAPRDVGLSSVLMTTAQEFFSEWERLTLIIHTKGIDSFFHNITPQNKIVIKY